MSGRELPTLEVVPAWRGATGSEPRHVLRPEYFGSLVYDRETFQYMPFDAEATGLLLDPARATGEAARAFVRGLEEEGLLGADGRFDGRVVADRAHPGRLSAPLTVYLGATEGCNLACSHCQADSGPGALVPFPPALMRALFEEQYALGAMQVHVTGGEPLLHPALFEGLEAAFELGLNVMLTTNATTLTPRLADALAARPFRTLSVSLDGADAASHDAIRGEGVRAPSRACARLRRPGAGGVTFAPDPRASGADRGPGAAVRGGGAARSTCARRSPRAARGRTAPGCPRPPSSTPRPPSWTAPRPRSRSPCSGPVGCRTRRTRRGCSSASAAWRGTSCAA
ncbi:MAG: radical SAM protein [Planctomycetota bacterium]